MSEYFGVDVAKWQGNINWAKVASDNKKFAILKVTNKNNKCEESFNGNYVGAIAAGIPVGVYRYVYAKTVSAAKAEANAIVANLKGKTIKCGVWLDMEDASIKGIGKANLTSVINAEADILQKAGYGVGIYCNRDWYYNVLDYKYLSEKYPFWIARYPSNDTGKYTSTSSLSPKSYAAAWQYSSKGKVNGIVGNVDLDVSFVDLSSIFKKTSIEYYPAYTGNSSSLIIALQVVGEKDVTLNHRAKIAVASGIVTSTTSYKGTAYQNTQMLSMLKSGKLVKA